MRTTDSCEPCTVSRTLVVLPQWIDLLRVRMMMGGAALIPKFELNSQRVRHSARVVVIGHFA